MTRLVARPIVKRSGGTEFNRGATFERYSGERTRGRVTAEGAALGGIALGAGAASSSLAGAKLAGTPLGQSALGSAETSLRAAGPQHRMAADQVGRYKRYGAWAGKNRLKATGGILGAGAVAGVARLGQKARQNEEAGISQGIGRMKAGEHYSNVRQRAVAKASLSAIALGTDVVTHPKVAPLARKAVEHKGKLTAGGLAVAGTGGAITAGRTSQKHNREYRKLRGELQPTGGVAKSAALLHGGRGFVTAGVATGAAGLGGSEALRRRGKEDAGRELAATTIGGWAGQGAYQGAMYGLKHKAIHEERKAGLSRAQKDKRLKPAKKEHGPFTAEMYRNYPKDLPGWKANRVTGYLGRGRIGQGLGAAATAAGGLAAVHQTSKPARVNGRGKKQTVEKLYVRDQETSLPRLLTAGAGLALGAWGLGHSRMVGAALSRGVKMAQGRQNPHAIAALQTAQAMQGALGRGTGLGERQLRQIRAVDRAVSRVPSAIRPEIALAAGTLLVGHARPIRRESYHPVNIRVRTGGF